MPEVFSRIQLIWAVTLHLVLIGFRTKAVLYLYSILKLYTKLLAINLLYLA